MENNKLFDSNAYKGLPPVMQSAVREIFEIIEKDKNITADNIVVKFESALDDVATLNSLEKEQIEQYFDEEIIEKLGEE